MNTYITDSTDSTETIISEIEAHGYKYHHTALTVGYVRKGHTLIEKYEGRFGIGYTIKQNNPNSTRYCYISYYTI